MDLKLMSISKEHKNNGHHRFEKEKTHSEKK